MWAYPLKSVLDLRRREQEAATSAFANATRERRAADEEVLRRSRAVQEARTAWEKATARDPGAPGAPVVSIGSVPRPTSGETLAAQERFTERLRHQWSRAQQALQAFRLGPLTSLRAAEQAARDSYVAAHRALRACEMHQATLAAAARREAERREVDAMEDGARAAHHHDTRDGRRTGQTRRTGPT